MPSWIGTQAVVVGAGIGGLTAARVVVLERDALPERAHPRAGVPHKLAAHDPAVHKLLAEVGHLLKPRSVLQDPELTQRLRTVMAEG
jgi:hypothetical protein